MIRKLVESPDLYNLILEKAGDKPETELSVKSEPRITRKVAKYDKFKHREYSVDLKSGLVWILNGPKEAGLQIILIPNGI